jgi:hypothetical protein
MRTGIARSHVGTRGKSGGHVLAFLKVALPRVELRLELRRHSGNVAHEHGQRGCPRGAAASRRHDAAHRRRRRWPRAPPALPAGHELLPVSWRATDARQWCRKLRRAQLRRTGRPGPHAIRSWLDATTEASAEFVGWPARRTGILGSRPRGDGNGPAGAAGGVRTSRSTIERFRRHGGWTHDPGGRLLPRTRSTAFRAGARLVRTRLSARHLALVAVPLPALRRRRGSAGNGGFLQRVDLSSDRRGRRALWARFVRASPLGDARHPGRFPQASGSSSTGSPSPSLGRRRVRKRQRASSSRARSGSIWWGRLYHRNPTPFHVDHLPAVDVARAIRGEKQHVLAISRGSPKRFRGFIAFASSMCSGATPHSCSQLPEIGPGARALTRISGATSRARDVVSPGWRLSQAQ